MNDRRMYIADARTKDLRNHHHHLRETSEEEAERRMRERYPEAVGILVRPEDSWRQVLAGSEPLS
jgi:hypothetical protein